MKRTLILAITLITLFSTRASAALADGGQKHLTAVFSYATFYHPDLGPYVETYISFDAWNLNFVKNNDKYQATVEVLLTVSKNDSIEVVKKYELGSPKINSPELNNFNFLDVQRFGLQNGVHDLTVTLRDKNSNDQATVVTQTLALLYDNRTTALSSVQTMSDVTPTTTPNILSRNGYDMQPYVNDFFPEQINTLNYYCELYNINLETRDEYIYSFSHIEIQETGKVLESTQSAQRHVRDTVIPIFGSIDISNLPSGNYNLVVEIRNRQNDNILFKRLPFIRSNPRMATSDDRTPVSMTFAGQLQDEQQLDEYIEALAPIANEIERRDIYALIHRPGLEEKQIFLYRFWTKREPLNAESAWREYRDRIDYVNANFSWPKTKGIQTDRGRVYLQYGPPDYVRDEKNFASIRHMGGGVTIQTIGSNDSFTVKDLNSPNVDKQGQLFYLPYQLWRYNQLPGDEPNRCFIFWDEFRSGFYKLLNSNARGEVRDPKWEQRLSQQQLNEDMKGDVGEQFDRGY